MSSKLGFTFEFLLFNGFSNMVLASAMEPLRDVKIRAMHGPLQLRVSTLDGEPVISSSGLRVVPDGRFDENSTSRILALVAGYSVRDLVTPELSAKLRKSIRTSVRVLALDTASWLLASAGVLEGRTATLHWQELDAFEEAFPNVGLSTQRFVSSGPFMTCGRASTALDMILELINELFGPAAAFEASTMFVYDPALQNEMNRGAQKFRDKGSPKVLMALNVMAENIETPLSTFRLAERVSLSERTLSRLFAQELGMTPGRYYKLFRLQRARYLAEETQLGTEQIALRCGFSSASSLGRSFSGVFGYSIREIRASTRPWPGS